MPSTFYGKWSLLVTGNNAPEFQQRVRIAGSLASDGPVPGMVGQQVAVIDGMSWDAYLEWSSDGGASWSQSKIARTPGVTPQYGLAVTLSADIFSAVLPLGGGRHGNMTVNIPDALDVQFGYLNPEVNPQGAYPPPFSFTLPSGSFYPQAPPLNQPAPCCCCGSLRCSCRHRRARYGR